VQSPPAFLISRVSSFAELTVFVKSASGKWTGKTHKFQDIHATYLDRQFAIPLKDLPADTAELVMVVKAPSQSSLFQQAVLSDSLPGTSKAEFGTLIIFALVCGLILMPLLFDFIFWRVLRQPFILWHAFFVCAIAGHLALTAGLYLPAISLTIGTVRLMAVSAFGMVIVAGMMFICAFLEREALSETMRRWMVAGAAAMAAATVLHSPSFSALGAWPSLIFHAVGAPVALINLIAAIHAWRRGSRYIRYIVVGFAPLFLVAVVRVISNLIPIIPADDMNEFFLFGVVVEASATAFGVAARFVHLKRERDTARSEAQILGELAGRDSLTGLLNRRSIEERFTELYRSGYETIAIIDLDHFKLVNDTFGHLRGDEVLCAVAAALETDESALAARIGGEEFLLLLHGKDGLQRAEHIRQAITVRVARDVTMLEQPVTASMGVVCVPPGVMPKASFADFYEMADKLLYEAKGQGRNRHVAQKLRAFRKRAADRRNRTAA